MMMRVWRLALRGGSTGSRASLPGSLAGVVAVASEGLGSIVTGNPSAPAAGSDAPAWPSALSAHGARFDTSRAASHAAASTSGRGVLLRHRGQAVWRPSPGPSGAALKLGSGLHRARTSSSSSSSTHSAAELDDSPAQDSVASTDDDDRAQPERRRGTRNMQLQLEQARQLAQGMGPALAGLARAYQLPPSDGRLDAIRAAFLDRAKSAKWSAGKQGEWLDDAAALEFGSWLQHECGLSQLDDVLKFLVRSPDLLQADKAANCRAVMGLLSQQLQAGSQDLRRFLLRSKPLPTLAPGQVSGTLQLLLTMRWEPGQLLQLVRSHERLLTVPAATLGTRFAFLVGLGLGSQHIAVMLQRQPWWVLRPLRHISTNWQFAQQELKAGPADLVHCPELLELSLMQVLGPRLAFAKKKRIKMLLPSDTLGLQILPSRKDWREHRMVPLQFWLSAGPTVMCSTMGLDEYKRYQRAWLLTTGEKWVKVLNGEEPQGALQQQAAARRAAAAKAGASSAPPAPTSSELLLDKV